MPKNISYRLSYTAASLLVEEMVKLASIVVENNNDWDAVDPSDLSRNKAASRTRMYNELTIRLKTLSFEELKFLATANHENQKLICIITFARTYSFFREFIEEVILEKIALFDYKITDLDFNAFIHRKSIDHDEVDRLAESTKAKLKQVLFKVLEQGGLIDNVSERNIIIPFIDGQMSRYLNQLGKADKRILLV